MKKLHVNRSIFSNESIEKTIFVYRNYAVMSVKYKKDYAVVTFRKCKYDEEQTVKEFENYMIGIENA